MSFCVFLASFLVFSNSCLSFNFSIFVSLGLKIRHRTVLKLVRIIAFNTGILMNLILHLLKHFRARAVFKTSGTVFLILTQTSQPVNNEIVYLACVLGRASWVSNLQRNFKINYTVNCRNFAQSF